MTSLQVLMQKIKPLCEQIMANPTIDKIQKLSNELELLDIETLIVYQDMLLVPLISLVGDIKIINENEIKTHLINCVLIILKKTKLRKFVKLKTLLVILFQQIYDVRKSIIFPELSEELKLSVIQCISIAVQRAESDVLEEIYVKQNSNLVSTVCVICVQLIQNETYKKLRLAAVNCLMSVMHVHDEADFTDVVLRDQIANSVFIFLPKIISTLLDVAKGDSKQGTIIISTSIKAFGRILTLVFQDSEKMEDQNPVTVLDFQKLVINSENKTEDNDKEILGIFSKNENIEKRKEKLDSLIRSSEWLTAASKKIQPIIAERFEKIRGNSNQKIRYELAVASCDFIENCYINMKACIPNLMETIISLSEDESESVSKKCTDCLKTLLKTNENFQLLENILNLFNSHLIKLPRIIYRGEENEQIAALTLLKGQIRLLSNGERLKIIFNNEQTLNTLMQILISSVELEYSNELLLEEYATRDHTAQSMFRNDSLPWKNYKNLKNPVLHRQVKEICDILGKSNVMFIFVNYILDAIKTDVRNCNELIILLNYVIDENEIKLNVLETIFDELLEEIHWDLTIHANDNYILDKTDERTSQVYEDGIDGVYQSSTKIRFTDVRWNRGENEEDSDSLVTLNDAKFHVLHICLVLETCGNLARFFKHRKDFYLMKCFHKILEKTGSSNYMIHLAGSYAVNQIKVSEQLETVSELIHRNSDYLTYYINKSLKTDEYKSGLDILAVVLKYSSINSIAHLENILNTVINHSSTSRLHTTSYLKVFHLFVNGVFNWTTTCDQKLEDSPISLQVNCDDIVKSWLEILDGTGLLEMPEDELSEEVKAQKENEDTAVEAEEAKPIIPKHIEFVLSILQICLKFISSKKQEDKLLVLETLNFGLQIIETYENELLPLVHLIWYNFAERFKETGALIIDRSFNLLVTLARLSKDFIRQRTLQDVVPILNSFLLKASKDSCEKHRETHYIFTQQFKLQRNLLLNYPKLVIDLEIQERELNAVMDCVIPYCTTQQPVQLQESCMDFFKPIFKYDSTALYLKLKSHLGTNNLVEQIFEKLFNKKSM